MSKKVGIHGNVRQVLISGARVPFDPRTTAEAHDTRDMTNVKANEKPLRAALRLQRLAEERAAERDAA